MTRDPSLALQFGAELAGCAQFDVIGEQPVVSWVRATLDNDTIRLQHEARHHAIFTTCGEQECDSGDDHKQCQAYRPFPDLPAARELEDHRSIPFSTWQSPFSKIGSLRAADLNPWRPVVPPRRHYCRGCDDACAYFNSKWEAKKPLARHAQAGDRGCPWDRARPRGAHRTSSTALPTRISLLALGRGCRFRILDSSVPMVQPAKDRMRNNVS